MLRAHLSTIEATALGDTVNKTLRDYAAKLPPGARVKGRLLTVTSTREKISLTLILTEDDTILPFFPDVEEVGYIITDTEMICEAESFQSRENRQAAHEQRTPTHFPPNMGKRSIPVMPVREPTPAGS